MTPVYAVPAMPFYQYDGTNSADLIDQFNSMPQMVAQTVVIVSEVAGVLTYESRDLGNPAIVYTTGTIRIGDYTDPSGGVVAAELFETQFIKVG